jgi:methylase of polypeptide subunit release factors
MPRLAPSVLHHARRKHPLLPILLRECRDTRSAQNELRWLIEHAIALQLSPQNRTQRKSLTHTSSALGWRTTLRTLVRRRAKGEPLQYILGTQPFGDLDVLCERGVLIPRPETEGYTVQLAELVRPNARAERQKLRVLDLCTGTGCISLLLHSLLRPPNVERTRPIGQPAGSLNAGLEILGVDISDTALQLARTNLLHNLRLGHLHPSAEQDISFAKADVLPKVIGNSIVKRDSAPASKSYIIDPELGTTVPSIWEVLQGNGQENRWDVLIANPPYISPSQFSLGGSTTRSVRRWESQLALVPRPLKSYAPRVPIGPEYQDQRLPIELDRGDEFYPPLLELARLVDAKAVVLEVGDNGQALRVRNMATQYFASELDTVVEVWRDDGTVDMGTSGGGRNGPWSECRAVVVWRSSWATWRMKNAQY